MSFDSYLFLFFLLIIIIQSVPPFRFSLRGIEMEWQKKATQRKIAARKLKK